MEYRRMGGTGLKLSCLSLGGWLTLGEKVDASATKALIEKAYEHGMNFFDNADVYAGGRAEIAMGEAIKGLPREALVLSSKVFWRTMEGPNGEGLSRKHIVESCHASLKRLRVDYLDLYFCHRFDAETPLEEVARAMDDLVHQGKVLYWGTSEWRAAQIAQAYGLAREMGLYPPSVEQPHYNMLVRARLEGEIAPMAQDLGIGLVTWSPLRSGFLTGKYNEGLPQGSRLAEHEWLRGILNDENLRKVRELTQLARELDVTTAQLAIAWLLRLPQVTSVITGATSAAQLEENLGALQAREKLSQEVLERIESILQNAPLQPG
jgi:voltage-dependent potassium channel beta subunit